MIGGGKEALGDRCIRLVLSNGTRERELSGLPGGTYWLLEECGVCVCVRVCECVSV